MPGFILKKKKKEEGGGELDTGAAQIEWFSTNNIKVPRGTNSVTTFTQLVATP